MDRRRRLRPERFLFTGPQLGLPFVPNCALLDARTAFPLDLHTHDGYEVCYLLSGETRWVLEGGAVLHLPGEAFSLIQPGVPHLGWFQRIDPCELVWLVFQPRTVRPHGRPPLLGKSLLSRMGAVFRAGGNAVCRGDPRLRAAAELFRDAVRLPPAGRAGAVRPAWMRTAVTQMLLSVFDLLCRRQSSRPLAGAGLVELCDRLLQERWGERIGVPELARHTGMHPSTFFARFRQQTGMTPADYLRRSRIRRAQELVVQTGKTITDIALDCGFSSSQHFADCFKEYTGIQPRAFRAKFGRAGTEAAPPG